MKRWIFAALAALCLALAIIPGMALAAPDGWVYNADGKTLTCVDDSSIVLENVTGDGNCLAIGDNSYNKEFTSIDLTGDVVDEEGNEFSITAIGDRAFLSCRALESVTIPGSVESIGARAFLSCDCLESIDISNGVTSIGDHAFMGCYSLKSVTIPGSVESIGDYAFTYCDGLTEVDIPDGVKSIGEGAFRECDGLAKAKVSSSIESIGSDAFVSCSSLKLVTVLATEPPSLGGNAFSECSDDLKIEVPHIEGVVEAYKGSWPQYGDRIVGIEGHHLVKTEAKNPTCTEGGNEEYWTCEWCGKHFDDAEGTVEVDSAEIKIPATGHKWGDDGHCTVCGSVNPDFIPAVTGGTNSSWHKGSGEGLTFTSDAAYDDFQKVQVDGKVVDSSNYTLREGSTIVTLKASYLETLPAGEHALEIVSDTGTAKTGFTVVDDGGQAAAGEETVDDEVADDGAADDGNGGLPAETGDDSPLPIAALFAFVIALAAARTFALRKLRQ